MKLNEKQLEDISNLLKIELWENIADDKLISYRNTLLSFSKTRINWFYKYQNKKDFIKDEK